MLSHAAECDPRTVKRFLTNPVVRKHPETRRLEAVCNELGLDHLVERATPRSAA